MSEKHEAGEGGSADDERWAAPGAILRLPIPRSVDLVSSAWALLGRYQGNTGVRTRLRVSRHWPQRIGEEAGAALHRILEQALEHIQTRSESASHVDVELESERDRLVLVVRADGGQAAQAGTPADDEPSLRRLHEWAIAHGGNVVVVSDGAGTTVRATVRRPGGQDR